MTRLDENLRKPLRCLWVSPSTDNKLLEDDESPDYSGKYPRNIPYSNFIAMPFTPIICVSVSISDQDDNQQVPSYYIQGKFEIFFLEFS